MKRKLKNTLEVADRSRRLWSLLGLGFLAVLAAVSAGPTAAASQEGVAVEIVYDTSGSMAQKVPDANGVLTPKNIIAARALNAVIDRLQAVAARPEGSRPVVHAGLVVFQTSSSGPAERAGIALKLGPVDAPQFRSWLARHNQPQRGTPLGDAVRVAGEAVLQSQLPRKHVLVITDGVNTQGLDPVRTIPRLQQQAEGGGKSVFFHFIAFDVNAEVFSGVKKLGATVVGAADEKQLGSQLEYILSKKILLEDEEPPPTKPK